MVDCNHCGSSKPRKKDARKKKAEARKKYVEALWERKQFYWKYEAVGSAKTKAKKKYLDEQDTLVSKIVPETEEAATPAVNEPLTPDEDFIDIPLGFQLSTITEGDEDVTARSMNRTISLGAGILQQDGKVKLNPQVVGSLLDNNNKNAAVSRSEDEIENVTKVDSVRPVAPVTNPGPKPSTKPQKQRKSRRSAHRRGVLTVNEISVPTADSDESVDSKGEISDITEDYLHIPFSSPLYSKVIQAFREASKFTDTKDADDSARKKYLQSVKF